MPEKREALARLGLVLLEGGDTSLFYEGKLCVLCVLLGDRALTDGCYCGRFREPGLISRCRTS